VFTPRFAGVATSVALAASSVALAEDADPVVAQVGSHVLRVSDVARRLAAVPRFRLVSFGATSGEIRTHFVESVLLPELRYAAESDRLKLDDRPDVASRIRDARRRALIDQIRREAAAQAVPEPQIQAYFDAHRTEFEQPERLRLARILTEDESLARKILEEARGAGGPERWTKLAREHSLDEATKMRGGTLGFVFPDGRTEYPQLHVDPVLYAAAARVKDGELVPDPVKEGNRFAIVWRRGTLPTVNRTLEDERNRITEVLIRKRTEDAVHSVLDGLRKQYVTGLTPELLESPLPGEAPPPSPSSAPRASASADPVPKQTERGLR
jgi:peptidyl-prolyl cis-trans isomerase C